MKPYAKLPLDATAELGLDDLTPLQERVFWRLYGLARHHEPLTGFLVDAEFRPYSARRIAVLTGIRRPTVAEALTTLRDRELLARASDGEFIPYIQDVAVRYKRRSHVDENDPSRPRLFPVDNVGGAPTGAWGVARFAPPNGTVSVPPIPIGVLELDDVRSVVSSTPGENPPEPALIDIDLAPPEIENDTARYLLGRLAAEHQAWQRAVTSPRDVANLVRLAGAFPGAFVEALRQQIDNPNAKNPLGWLNATVRMLAEPTEVGA